MSCCRYTATLTERTQINFVSGVVVITYILYISFYLTGSFNPGGRPIVDFEQFAEKLMRGKFANKSY
ncbi:MAG TPA: hypothetical protein EYP35_09045 [Desulfobacterales bacterium]|nr:hypothetical protein [Desulfobacterales bacterium]HIP38594.1 hypothetical protein [Desulfocapsa sulfexigens]